MQFPEIEQESRKQWVDKKFKNDINKEIQQQWAAHTSVTVWLFIGTQGKVSGLLLCPICSRRDGLNLSVQCDLSTFLSTTTE
jgi:hypothetical protein